MTGFPRLYAAASLKLLALGKDGAAGLGFPRLYAAASLKHHPLRVARSQAELFSAALCRGLIEAAQRPVVVVVSLAVFRGFMPRPH